MESAILMEKRIKEWKRAWKLRLIEAADTGWEDLYNAEGREAGRWMHEVQREAKRKQRVGSAETG